MSNSKSVSRTQRRKKQYAVDYFGGKCSICGYSKCLQSLDFHHLDPNEKGHKPSYIILRWSWDRVVEELNKCILVCRNCHGEIHFGMFKVEDLKKHILPIIEKTCPQCQNIFRTKSVKQVHCSDRCNKILQRRVLRPNKEQLSKDIAELSWVGIGRKYGVSDNAIRKWARNYELLPPKL
jgi:hypothetical protein